jgi:hypothetical protein
MKTLMTVLTCAGVLFITVNVLSQSNSTLNAKQLAQQQTDQIKKNVDKVTPTELSRILPAEQEFANGIQDARRITNGDTLAMYANVLRLSNNRDTEIQMILTAIQYSQYLDMEKGWGCKLNCTSTSK